MVFLKICFVSSLHFISEVHVFGLLHKGYIKKHINFVLNFVGKIDRKIYCTPKNINICHRYKNKRTCNLHNIHSFMSIDYKYCSIRGIMWTWWPRYSPGKINNYIVLGIANQTRLYTLAMLRNIYIFHLSTS